MWGKENYNEWNTVNFAPQVYGGYRTEMTTVTKFDDDRTPEVSNYSFDYKQHTLDGLLYSYRLTPFGYPKLRTNGISPLCVMDLVVYDYHTKKLLKCTSGLVNSMKSDSIISSIAVMQIAKDSFWDQTISMPPVEWDCFQEWSKSIPNRDIFIEDKDWSLLLQKQVLYSTQNYVQAKEIGSPWKIVQGVKIENCYLVIVEIFGKSGGVVRLKGVTSGKLESRRKSVVNFIESLAIAVDIP